MGNNESPDSLQGLLGSLQQGERGLLPGRVKSRLSPWSPLMPQGGGLSLASGDKILGSLLTLLRHHPSKGFGEPRYNLISVEVEASPHSASASLGGD